MKTSMGNEKNDLFVVKKGWYLHQSVLTFLPRPIRISLSIMSWPVGDAEGFWLLKFLIFQKRVSVGYEGPSIMKALILFCFLKQS